VGNTQLYLEAPGLQTSTVKDIWCVFLHLLVA